MASNYKVTPEFVTLVKEMRQAQKRYFKTRLQSVLETARALELQTDNWIQLYEQQMEQWQRWENGQLPDLSSSGDDRYYTVQPGDTLSAIALRFDTTVDELMRLNPQIADPDLIVSGEVIQLPRGV
jgi:nucleoid-associated protein YgaU